MRFVGENAGVDAGWVLEHAQVRAMARRQLGLSIPLVIAGAFVAVLSTFTLDRAGPPVSQQPASHSSPNSRHFIVLMSASSDEAVKATQAKPLRRDPTVRGDL
jgi:hypothetical protein